MSGHKPYSELREKVRARPGAEERIARYRAEEEQALTLAQLRRAREFTQAQLAQSLETGQGHVSRLERQTDLYLSTLRSYVEAMGGRLEIHAIFEDSDIVVEQLGEEHRDVAGAELIGVREDAEVPEALRRLAEETETASN